ncbi:hypothetical protein C2845_PM01G42390 [Panicum miliaceum]|uniref:Uncharacterized protein n=1 Tax=Panicum miliaceum TaxID=4540 RepID=A0A3L6TMI5_PANMI|nr:hypothetical protein C2845_PM01G42390 [Panicum miliaceum]
MANQCVWILTSKMGSVGLPRRAGYLRRQKPSGSIVEGILDLPPYGDGAPTMVSEQRLRERLSKQQQSAPTWQAPASGSGEHQAQPEG